MNIQNKYIDAKASNAAFNGAIHASSVVIGSVAVLMIGQSGSGKSDLALRLIDRGAKLLCDDYTYIEQSGSSLIARPSENISGLIEVRGVGLLNIPYEAEARVGMIVLLLNADDKRPERMPELRDKWILCGLDVPVLALNGFESSAPIKIELAINSLTNLNDTLRAAR